MRVPFRFALGHYFILVAGALIWPLAALTESVSDRVHLPADAILTSLGGLSNTALTRGSCDTFNGNFACAAPGNNCVSCSTNNYTLIIVGTSTPGYQNGTGFQNCGNNFAGTCNMLLQCVTGGNPVGACASPASAILQ